tara:strand:- start:1331 stop:2752 length:1422 start_codon:yes stop_codon:yes gene_type:complete
MIKPIILCGGTGSRLWPLSRRSYPKQFISLNSDSDKSMLQQTFERLSKVKNISNPIFISNEEHRFIVGEQIRAVNCDEFSIILEPEGRNTGAAISIGALKAIEDGHDPILLVLSSDHKINNNLKFVEAIEKAETIADEGFIVNFGIIPTYPETGFGYIKSERPLKNDIFEKNKIINFTEKPNQDLAEKYIIDKNFSWNSGIFVFKASVILKEIEKYHPEIIKFSKEAFEKKINDLDFERLDKDSFLKSPSIPIDKAVMEKTNLAYVLPLNVDWNDIGSWKALWEIERKDDFGNVTEGKVFTKDTKNCYLRSENTLMVVNGIEDIVVVENGDAMLISKKDNSHDIKEIISELKDKGFKEIDSNKKGYRPWGYYLSIAEDKGWQVKKIVVKPRCSISLQMHRYRSEHWVIVEGNALVEIEQEKTLLNINQSIYIPLGSKHRLSNPGKEDLILIEVQSGSYIGEDDIIRFKDDYGR